MTGRLGSLLRGRSAGPDSKFAAAAERLRRQGDLTQAVDLCREGLQKFPDQLSARVTLGCALMELERYDEARAELEAVIRKAPDNLAAIRGLAELHDREETASLMAMEQSGEWPPPSEEIGRVVAEHPAPAGSEALTVASAEPDAVPQTTSDLLEEAEALEALAERNEAEAETATLDLAPEETLDLEAIASSLIETDGPSALTEPAPEPGLAGFDATDALGAAEILLDAEEATGSLDELVDLEAKALAQAEDAHGYTGGDDDPTSGGGGGAPDGGAPAGSGTATESALDALERLLDRAKARQQKVRTDSAA